MSYKFLKIESTREGQLAYLLDEDRGVVVVAPVEYMGEVPAEVKPIRRRATPVLDYIEEDVPRARTIRREFTQEVEEVPAEVEYEDEAPPVRPAAKPAKPPLSALRTKDLGKSIIPPHLRGVFVRPGKPGADTEQREV